MKRLIFLFTIFFFLAFGSAQQIIETPDASGMQLNILGGGSGGGAAPPSCDDSTCTGFLLCQNFEGPGYDNEENWSEITSGGSVDDEDQTATVGRGDYQLKLVNSTGPVQAVDATAGRWINNPVDEVYGHFLFRIADATPAGDQVVARLYKSNSDTLATIYLNSGSVGGSAGSLIAYVSGDAYPDDYKWTTDTLSDDTWYHIWVHYDNSSGASNGIWSIEFTAAATRSPVGSGNKFIAVTDHNNTAQAYQLGARIQDTTGTAYYDQFLARATAITTVCE